MLESNHLFLEGLMTLKVPIPHDTAVQFRNYFEFQLKAASSSYEQLIAFQSLKHFDSMVHLEEVDFTVDSSKEEKVYLTLLNAAQKPFTSVKSI